MQNKVQTALEVDYEIHSLGGGGEPRLKKQKDSTVQQHVIRVFKTLYSSGFTRRYIQKRH